MGKQSSVAIVTRGVLLLAILATCAAVWGDDKKPGERNRALFEQVKKMSLAEQQAWLAQLERRALLAAELTLPPDEAAKQQARTRKLLHQKVVTWQVLGQVLAETEAREKSMEVARLPELKEETVKVETKKPAAKPEPVTHVVAKPQAVDTVAKPQAVGTEGKLPPGSVTVDVEELEARIAGCNLAFREFETGLGEKDAGWNATKLEPLFERLKILVLRHGDLNLHRNAVPKGERSGVTQLESTRSAISEFSARVVEARNRANDPKAFADEAERQAELARLGVISRGLAELGGK